ncbi:hypothetical protein VNI00_011321 [Paramarasmius palmivorus]|uniref:Uncharacterized protein n=1 Tax=Paramarasmius palmivorus TaxID=297713 RepID=A0AAW0CBU8_9AGAR
MSQPQSQSNVPSSSVQPNMQPSNVRIRLDALQPTSSRKEQKNVDLIKTWLEDLNQAFPGHKTDAAPCALFYSALEEYMAKAQNRSTRWNRQSTTNLSKVENEYLLLRPHPGQPQPSTSSRAITLVDHTARTLSVIGEAVPGAAPLKGVGNALERIAELAKTMRGNKDEASRLSKHADHIQQLLNDKLGSAENIDKEVEKDLRAFGVYVNFPLILTDLERFQKPNEKRLQAFLFAKDQRDELRGLQQRLHDAFQAFLTANTVAIRLGVARFESLYSSSASNRNNVGLFPT